MSAKFPRGGGGSKPILSHPSTTPNKLIQVLKAWPLNINRENQCRPYILKIIEGGGPVSSLSQKDGYSLIGYEIKINHS